MTVKQLAKYLKETEFDIQSARANLLVCDVVFSSYVNSRATKKILDRVCCYLRLYDNSDLFHQITEKKIMERVGHKVYKDFLYNKPAFFERFKDGYKLEKEIDLLWARYVKGKKNKNYSKSDLLFYLDEFIKLFKKWWGCAAFGEDKSLTIYQEFLPGFMARHKILEADAQEIIGLLTHPKNLARFNEERRDYLNLCLYAAQKQFRLKNDLKFKKLAEKYIKNYFWIKTDYYSKTEITLDSLAKEVKKSASIKNPAEIKREISKINISSFKIKKQKQEILKNLKLSKKDKQYIAFARQMVAWHDERKAGMMKQFYYLFSLIEDISVATRISYDDAVACFFEELRRLLKENKFVKKREKNIFLLFDRDKKTEIFDGKIARIFLKILEKKNKIVKELKGMLASRGQEKIVRGLVRIVTDPLTQKFKEGEILVTSMTRIEFVPIIKKARAIITDEGGIACHAAIISRELDIPCIIGTKNATKVLKSGDLIEMNMEKGIVKIIKT